MNENSTGGLKNKGEAAFQKQQQREAERGRERDRARTGQSSSPDTWRGVSAALGMGLPPARDQPVGAGHSSAPAAGSCRNRLPAAGDAADRLLSSTQGAPRLLSRPPAIGPGLSLRKSQMGGPGRRLEGASGRWPKASPTRTSPEGFLLLRSAPPA